MIDRHHLIYERSTYQSNKYGRELRNTRSLIPMLDRDTHNEIHKQCPPVPMLGTMALTRTLSYFRPTQDTYETIERLQSAMERATSGRHRIEHDLAELAIMSLDMQKKFIPNLSNNEKIILL